MHVHENFPNPHSYIREYKENPCFSFIFTRSSLFVNVFSLFSGSPKSYVFYVTKRKETLS